MKKITSNQSLSCFRHFTAPPSRLPETCDATWGSLAQSNVTEDLGTGCDWCRRKASLTNSRRKKKKPQQKTKQKKRGSNRTNPIPGCTNTPRRTWKLPWWNSSESQTLNLAKSNHIKRRRSRIVPSISTAADCSVLPSSLFSGTGCSASAGDKRAACGRGETEGGGGGRRGTLWCWFHFTLGGFEIKGDRTRLVCSPCRVFAAEQLHTPCGHTAACEGGGPVMLSLVVCVVCVAVSFVLFKIEF